ncbi:hypothetical protein JTM56_36680, partial [Pseudomonas aeruginosa]|nr:hypothetical protein [Pseudomonas aeruginosa]
FQSLAAAVFPEAGSEAGAACAVALVATPIAPAPAPPITTVGISAIDFTRKSRLELLVFSLDIITFLSLKITVFVADKTSECHAGTDTIALLNRLASGPARQG